MVIDRVFAGPAEVQTSGMTRRAFVIWGGLIAAVAAIVRFWDLGGASIWMDEAVSLGLSDLPVDAILFARIDNHPPLSFLILHYWHDWFPGLAMARVPSAFLGAATVVIMILMMADQTSRRAALFAGLLIAFSTSHIFFSQDLRMYAVLLYGLSLALWGGIGLANPRSRSLLFYSALYVLGAVVAIYSHAIGIVCMGIIGFSSLLSILTSSRGVPGAQRWFLANIVVLILVLPWLLQIPGASSTFGGVGSSVTVFDSQWFYRNAVGFPALGGFGTLLEMTFLPLALLGVYVAYRNNNKALAVAMGAVAFAYPALLVGMHLNQSVLSTRTMLPAILGVVMASAYAIDQIRVPNVRDAVICLFVGAAILSSISELNDPAKLEDNRGALAFVSAEGAAEAPVITCHDYTAAALWEEDRSRAIHFTNSDDTIRYKSSQYWSAAQTSMSNMRQMSLREIDAYLGGGWLVEGGLGSVLNGQDEVSIIRSYCGREVLDAIESELARSGFVATATWDSRRPESEISVVSPQTIATVYKRS